MMDKSIKKYKGSPLNEKRFVLSELFSAYENLINHNYQKAEESVSRARSYLGENPVTGGPLTEILNAIYTQDYGCARDMTRLTIKELINNISPMN